MSGIPRVAYRPALNDEGERKATRSILNYNAQFPSLTVIQSKKAIAR